MKRRLIPLLLLLLSLGWAHSPLWASSPAPEAAALQSAWIMAASDAGESLPNSPALAMASGGGSPDGKTEEDQAGAAIKKETATTPDGQQPSGMPGAAAVSGKLTPDNEENLDYVEETPAEERPGIADPLEPFNRAMYHFNDKLYFWVLKPAAQGYQKVVPEKARVSVGNFFSNLAFPIRFVNCLLQANFSGAATEAGRFMVNTIWGIGGLMDPAAGGEMKLSKQDGDFGQTLGVYGVGQGFFINWPILGPSSPRDTAGTVGDFFLHPLTYVATDWETDAGIRAYQKVNATSLSIGDYESLKEAAIDPYVAIRDAYVQYRLQKVNAAKRIKPTPADSR